jgi:hypothetical protein
MLTKSLIQQPTAGTGGGRGSIGSTTSTTTSGSGSVALQRPSGHKNQLGVLNGVFVPCLLNIMGIILFLRLSWAVGQVGSRATLFSRVVATHRRQPFFSLADTTTYTLSSRTCRTSVVVPSSKCLFNRHGG